MTSGPSVRAQSETGRTWDDPSPELLHSLLEELGSGPDTFLILTRTSDPDGQTYAQVLRQDDGSYVVEHRDGGPEQHYGTVVDNLESAHALLTGWAFGTPGWKDTAVWAPVDV